MAANLDTNAARSSSNSGTHWFSKEDRLYHWKPYRTILSSDQQFYSSFARMDSAKGQIFSHNIGGIEIIGSGNNVSIRSSSQNFVGRKQESEQMRKFFFGDRGVFDRPRIFLLIGVGGCGKTQLARRSMHRVYGKVNDGLGQALHVDASTL
ncbi:hypothetical protein BDV98DRAFT_594346 [Pterulicium gracile]|uniref:P-loop containing nucleoside triphosphate hydrolase protein n=1 Tax=Pterulicium gracile TaxID=1884261 RepID=A0A5C3QDP4_9AGAR|nr:hypothetical protein BDV98DRAFT_594346 [Pterula gracilis]